MSHFGVVTAFGAGSPIVFPYLHSSETVGHCANYCHCKLCGGEMLVDSCSQICGREMCRQALIFLSLQSAKFREEFWERFDALPREARNGGLHLWDMEQMMAEAEGEVA